MTYDNDFGTTGGRMDTVGGTSLSAMFDSHDDAQRAVDRLVQAGIPMAQVRMVSGGSASTTTTSTTRTDDDKGFWDSLSDFFFPDEDRYAYAEGLSRGGYGALKLALRQPARRLSGVGGHGNILSPRLLRPRPGTRNPAASRPC